MGERWFVMVCSFDGETISDMVHLADLASWLRRSTRDETCVLVSQKTDGKPVAPLNRIRKRVGERAVVVMLSNNVQRTARGQLGSVNPYHGAIRIFPAGDMWMDDYRLVRFVRGDLSAEETLEVLDEQLDVVLTDAARRSMETGARKSVLADSWKAPARAVRVQDGTAKEQPSKPTLADVRGRNKLYLIDMERAGACADFILNKSREIPCILVALPDGGTEPYLDVDALLDEIGDDAAVLRIMDHDVDDRLNNQSHGLLPPWARAYDGACRFLPPHSSNKGARLCRLRGPEDSARAIAQLSELTMDVAYSDGYTVGGERDDDGSDIRTVPADTMRASIMMVVGDAVYVGDDGSLPRRVDCASAATLVGIPVERLVCKGQSIPVRSTSGGGLELVPEWRGSDEALSDYVQNRTVVGVVSAVYSDMLVVTLYPALGDMPVVEAKVHGPELLAGSGADPCMDLRPVVRKGEPVALRVEDRSGSDWLFSLPDASDEMIPPAALLDGGPAWVDAADAFAYLKRIREHRSLADMLLDELLDSVHSMEDAKNTISRLHERLRDVERLNRELDCANENLRRSNDGLRRDNRGYEKAQDNTNPLAPFTGLFPSIREEIDWQLQAQSLLQFNVADRMARPLDEWSYSPGFFDALMECEHGDMSRSSLLHTMLFVLMGHDDLNGARTHRLRKGSGGDDADRLDENGNYIYRVNVHGQYRLHYTRDAARHVTFRSVGVHDAELW
jgi:hypothetical protein